MKQTLLFTALGLMAFGAAAQEVGHVLSSTPVVQQVAVPRQICSPGVPMQAPTSGGGGVLGALAGGAVGSFVGNGAGHTAAIIGGTVLGAIVGNNVEANHNRYVQSAPNCTTQTTYENHIVGYNVTYEYAGRQFSTQMPNDPGATVVLRRRWRQRRPAATAFRRRMQPRADPSPPAGRTIQPRLPAASRTTRHPAAYPAPTRRSASRWASATPAAGAAAGYVFGWR